ncbi:MAG: sigma-70 family RNA polymerase sigma factor [Chloroflexota bacterium]
MADYPPLSSSSSPASVQFDELFRLQYPRLVPLVERLLADRTEAEDVVQEAFLRLARTGPGDDGASREPALLDRSEDVLAAWLRRVVLNLGLNRLRDRRRAAERQLRAGRLDPELDPERAAEIGNPAIEVLRAEARAEVQTALAALPERQRTCLLLRHAGHSYAEIAETLGIAVGSVGVYLARAERAFRTAYHPDAPADGAAPQHRGLP